MCKAFSAIVLESGEVLWKMGIDSHDDLLREFKIADRKAKPNFARVEYAPQNDNYLRPDKWAFRLDEQVKPEWWKPIYETYVIEAWREWWKKICRIVDIKKSIVHPFRDIVPPKKITKKHLDLLKQWASVRASVGDSFGDSVGASVWASVRASVMDSVGDSAMDSVWDSVWDSVGASVRASVRASVMDSVGASVWDSVGASVMDSVWDSVWDSVGASVMDSVWDSVGGYVGSFLRLPKKEWKYTENIKGKGYPLQPVVDLWNMGLVPSVDGKKWRLHGGKDAKILWEGEIK